MTNSNPPDRGICAIDDCDKPAWARGWCHMHLQRWYHHGDPTHVTPKPKRSYCVIFDCERIVNSGGLCDTHVRRLRKHGSTDNPRQTVEERFWSKVDKEGPEYEDLGRCWEWTAAVNENGYGLFGIKGRHIRVHRWSYEQANGPIPKKHDIDHICGNRLCVNPAHLRDATRKQNMENYTVRHRHNKTGYRGVYFNGSSYIAQVHHLGRTIHVGSFSTAEAAGEASRLKRLELFTHNDRDHAA